MIKLVDRAINPIPMVQKRHHYTIVGNTEQVIVFEEFYQKYVSDVVGDIRFKAHARGLGPYGRQCIDLTGTSVGASVTRPTPPIQQRQRHRHERSHLDQSNRFNDSWPTAGRCHVVLLLPFMIESCETSHFCFENLFLNHQGLESLA